MDTKRNASIDILKFILAVLIVFLHTPWYGSEFFTPFTRCAVPCFFMISGFCMYKPQIKNKKKYLHAIRKISIVLILSCILYIIYNISWHFAFGSQLIHIDISSIFRFLIFGENPFRVHLWFFMAYIQVLSMFLIIPISEINKRFAIGVIISLLLINLVFGTYSEIILSKSYDLIYTRNFLFIGVPSFLMGCVLKDIVDVNELKSIAGQKYLRLYSYMLVVIGCISTMIESYHLINSGVGNHHDFFFGSFPIALGLLMLFVTIRSKDNLISRLGRDYSLLLFILHPIVIDFYCIARNKISNISSISFEIMDIVAPLLIIFCTLISTHLIKSIKQFVSRRNLKGLKL